MKLNFNSFSKALAIGAGLFLFSACEKDQVVTPGDRSLETRSPNITDMPRKIPFLGLTSSNEIIWLTTGNSASDQGAIAISGLNSNEQILAIDFRPASGQLYGISNHNKLYTIHTNTGLATAVSSAHFSPAINGAMVGFDFNPTVDRIRVVTSAEQNLRLHPVTGQVVFVDGAINPGDLNLAAAAYINSFAGATSTLLYTIDFMEGKLYKQNPPNNGTQEEIGSLGIHETGDGGFDISPDNSVALAVVNGDPESPGKKSNFFFINLESGKATPAGVSKRNIIGVAIPPQQ
ncbi:MAG TPA: DUF4394 domain-containing protein [Saprospiraceae bacterium]